MGGCTAGGWFTGDGAGPDTEDCGGFVVAAAIAVDEKHSGGMVRREVS